MTGAQSSPSFDTFTCFQRLPPELRIRVWDFAIKEPRVLNFTIIRGHRERTQMVGQRTWPKQWPDNTMLRELGPPGVLQANQESRYEAQKVKRWKNYKKAYASSAYHDTHHDKQLIKWFRNDVDIAYFQAPYSLKGAYSGLRHAGFTELYTVNNIAISLDLYDALTGDRRQENFPSSFLSTIQCKNLFIVIKDKTFEWKAPSNEPGDADDKDQIFQNDGWLRTGEEPLLDHKAIHRSGFNLSGLSEVRRNTDYAQFLEAQFERLRVIKIEKWKKHKPQHLATMGLKVLSE